MKSLRHWIIAIMLLPLAACGGGEVAPPPASADAAGTAQAGTAPEGEKKQQEEKGFDANSVPLSDVSLGAFPYLQPPEGYQTSDRTSTTYPVAEFPFWTGETHVGVTGRIHVANIRASAGREFAAAELSDKLDERIRAFGGTLLSASVVPRDLSGEILTRAFTEKYRYGLCWPQEPMRTYLIRRTDRHVWIQTCTYGSIGGAWVIGEVEVAAPAAELVSSAELREKLEKDGRIALQIHFASGSAQLLDTAQPQLQQMADLMAEIPQLRLSVNGHTDNIGNAQHNRTLSQQRAEAVARAIVAKGIDAGRLEAIGIGYSQPIADNDTAEGRAANRRTEFVRI